MKYKKIMFILYVFIAIFSFSGEISVKSGFSMDFNDNRLEIYDYDNNKLEFSDKNDNRDKFKDYNVPVYFNLSLDYTEDIYKFNDKLKFKMTEGIDIKVGYVSLINTTFHSIPIHTGVYVEPKLEYKFENDVKINTGLKLGVGFVADKYILKKENLDFEVKVDRDVFYTAVFPIETTLGLQYKNILVNLEAGGKIYVPNNRDALTSKFILKQVEKDNYMNFKKEAKIKFVPSIGINIGYSFFMK